MKAKNVKNQKCMQCKKLFTSLSFQEHSCVKNAMKMSPEDLIRALYKSGGCSKEFAISRGVQV